MTHSPPADVPRLRDQALGFEPEAFAIVRRDDFRPITGRRDIHDWLSGGKRKDEDPSTGPF